MWHWKVPAENVHGMLSLFHDLRSGFPAYSGTHFSWDLTAWYKTISLVYFAGNYTAQFKGATSLIDGQVCKLAVAFKAKLAPLSYVFVENRNANQVRVFLQDRAHFVYNALTSCFLHFTLHLPRYRLFIAIYLIYIFVQTFDFYFYNLQS